MNSNIFSFVQSKEEINFLLKKEKKLIFIPLNLASLIYLDSKKIHFINPINLIDNRSHKNFLIFSENFLKKLKFGKIKYEGLKIEFKAQIRFIINSCIFLIEIYRNLEKKGNIYLFQSGWNGKNNNYGSDEIFLASRIISKCLKGKNLYFLNDDYKKKIELKKLYSFKPKKNWINENDILINNLGYNFFRLFFYKNFSQKIFRILFERDKIGWFKKIVLTIFGYKEIEMIKTKEVNKIDFKIPKIKLVYKNVNISKLVNDRKIELENDISDLYFKIIAIKKIPNIDKFKYYFSYHNRGLDGCISELLDKSKCNTFNITHGTVSPFYGKYDGFYKKIIAESVFAGKFKNYAIQSKICEKSLINTCSKIKKTIKTDNLIFANIKTNIDNKKKALYAVTLKKFHGLQFFGVEMYYEFYENLKLLNSLSLKKYCKKIIVNIHPSHKNLVKDLKKIFPKLLITSQKIDKLIDQSFLLISFSSSAIEDAISSNRFVILFDQWKRYLHFKGKIFDNFNSIFYVNTKSQLKKVIKKIYFEKEELKNHKISNNLKDNFKKILN